LWSGPLLEVPELSPDGVKEVLGPLGASGMTRRRAVFYALAQWLAADRRRAQVAA
jgi:hypothetical protein